MKLLFKAHRVEVPAGTLDHVRRRLRIVLGRFGSRVLRIDVRLADENGPRGGVDTSCRIEARVAGRPPVVVVDRSDELRLALDRAIRRLERAVERTTARGRRVEPMMGATS